MGGRFVVRIVSIVLLLVFASVASCKLADKDGKLKLYDSRNREVSITLAQGAMECLALHADPTDNKVRFTDEVGNNAYLRKDVSNCHFIATMAVGNNKRVKIYRTMEDIIALVSNYFCKTKLTQVNGLCDDALAAIGNLAWIISLNINKEAEGDNGNYHRMDENLMPELIPVSKIPPSAEALKQKYTVHHNHKSILPIKAYMTYIFSHLKAQLEDAKRDYSVEVNKYTWFKERGITASGIEKIAENFSNFSKFSRIFFIGEIGENVLDNGRHDYLSTCFKLVDKLFRKELDSNIKKKYPLSPHIIVSPPYVEGGSVSLNKLRTYRRYGYSSVNKGRDGRFNIIHNQISLIVPLAKAQIELENTLQVIARGEKINDVQKAQVSTKIKEYVAAIKKPRFIIEEYHHQKDTPIFANYREQEEYFLDKFKKDKKQYEQQTNSKYQEYLRKSKEEFQNSQ